jgi:TfoX/Sxy family transcriptional regulator of competence genes
MAFDEKLGERIRKALGKRKGVGERKMFGGLCFTFNGHMVAGVVGDRLMLRVGPDQHEAALKLKHAQPMDFNGKPMKGMVYVAPEGCRTPGEVKPWITRALKFVEALPPK